MRRKALIPIFISLAAFFLVGGAAYAAPQSARAVEWFDFNAFIKLTQKSNLVAIFRKGGPVMWPLLVASILALGTTLDRVFFLAGTRLRRNRKAQRRFLTAIADGNMTEADRIGNASKDHVVRTLGYALQHKEKSLANALVCAQEREMKRFRRGIPILDTVITLAPLLGLLGTVTGMMGSFSLIGGELSAPGAITGGIAEALIATAFGLGIAITSLLPFNYINNRMDEARIEIETAATQLEMMVQRTEPASVKPASTRRTRRESPAGHVNRTRPTEVPELLAASAN
jgi:biopolymer transport protein ExbB